MKKQLDKKILSLSIIATGVLAIIFAILCWTKYVYFYSGSYVRNQTYGGDAYTGIQNAAAATANNVSNLINSLEYFAEIICECMGYLLFIIGMVLLWVGIYKTINAFKKESQPISEDEGLPTK